MKIDGRQIASDIKYGLKQQIIPLRKKHLIPHLAVILIGNDPNSLAYIRQKQKVGRRIKAKVSLFHFQSFIDIPNRPVERTISKQKLFDLIDRLNNNPLVHGIIIQRPMPIDIDKNTLDSLVVPGKDVDGFHPKSPFIPPVAQAVLKILEWAHQDIDNHECHNYHATVRGSCAKKLEIYLKWLKKQSITIIGRGETAGKPIAKTFDKFGVSYFVAHSKTHDMGKLCLSSNIIITCVGRPNIVRLDMITNKTILIGVGLHSWRGRLYPDYDQVRMAKKASYYTTVPGGVGPVNVAYLYANLLKAVTLG